MESGAHAPRTGSSKMSPPASRFLSLYSALADFFFWVGRDVTCLDVRLRVVVCVTAQTYWERRDIHKTLYAMHLVSLSLL